MRSIDVSPEGSKVFVTGGATLRKTGTYGYATIAYDASTGEQLWVRLYNGPNHLRAFAEDLGASPDGSTVFVTGYAFDSYVTVAYDALTGERLWVSRYKAPGEAFFLGVSPDGSRVFVTGLAFDVTLDYVTVAIDSATGKRLWVSRYNGRGNDADWVYDLGVSPDGSMVFVTGASVGTDRGEYATVAYDAVTGARSWVRRYNGPGKIRDGARGLAVSPDSAAVYVTGISGGQSFDYVTIAYSTR